MTPTLSSPLEATHSELGLSYGYVDRRAQSIGWTALQVPWDADAQMVDIRQPTRTKALVCSAFEWGL
jgi:hypothetical protein